MVRPRADRQRHGLRPDPHAFAHRGRPSHPAVRHEDHLPLPGHDPHRAGRRPRAVRRRSDLRPDRRRLQEAGPLPHRPDPVALRQGHARPRSGPGDPCSRASGSMNRTQPLALRCQGATIDRRPDPSERLEPERGQRPSSWRPTRGRPRIRRPGRSAGSPRSSWLRPRDGRPAGSAIARHRRSGRCPNATGSARVRRDPRAARTRRRDPAAPARRRPAAAAAGPRGARSWRAGPRSAPDRATGRCRPATPARTRRDSGGPPSRARRPGRSARLARRSRSRRRRSAPCRAVPRSPTAGRGRVPPPVLATRNATWATPLGEARASTLSGAIVSRCASISATVRGSSAVGHQRGVELGQVDPRPAHRRRPHGHAAARR